MAQLHELLSEPALPFPNQGGQGRAVGGAPIGVIASLVIAEARGFLAVDNRYMRRLTGRVTEGTNGMGTKGATRRDFSRNFPYINRSISHRIFDLG